MVRATKTPLSEVKNVDVVVVTESPESIIKVKKTNEKKSKKVVPVVVVTPEIVEPVAIVEQLVPVLLPDTELLLSSDVAVDTIPSKMLDVALKFQQIISLMVATKVQFKALEKIVAKDFKINQKATSKKSKRSGNRNPSGFVRPTLISDELALFLGKEKGVEMARTSVSKEINQYIITHGLQDKKDRRIIMADVPLHNLLKIREGDEKLTYFNLQKFLKHHFIKTTPDVVVVPSPVVV